MLFACYRFSYSKSLKFIIKILLKTENIFCQYNNFIYKEKIGGSNVKAISTDDV